MTYQEATLAIVGGGAAGLAAAIAAGDCALETGLPLRIIVYERDDRVGRSILATGNGRCNFSNSNLLTGGYYNAEFVEEVFAALGETSADSVVHRFFEGCGLAWREEEDGRQYPRANKASVVVDVLRAAAACRGVVEACGREVSSIDPPRSPGKRFTLKMSDGVLERADAVVVACGGKAVSSLEAHGAPVLRTRPVLGPLKVTPEYAGITRELDNIRVKCAVALERKRGARYERVALESGELMFRKYGLSGICVFNLSRLAWPGDYLFVDLLQEACSGQVEENLRLRWRHVAGRYGESLTYADFLRGLLLPRVSEALLKHAGIALDDSFSSECIPDLANLLTRFPFEVSGIADPEKCQVRRGGFDVAAFDPNTLGCRGVAGLHAAGEALDVDGPCGGYNLHWAWASGMAAGSSAAKFLAGDKGECA